MRTQDPAKYAEVLLSLVRPNDHYTKERIEHMYGPNEINIDFPTFMPINVTYQTAFVDDDGKLQFRDDIYGRDRQLLAIMHNPNEMKIADVPVEHSDLGDKARNPQRRRSRADLWQPLRRRVQRWRPGGLLPTALRRRLQPATGPPTAGPPPQGQPQLSGGRQHRAELQVGSALPLQLPSRPGRPAKAQYCRPHAAPRAGRWDTCGQPADHGQILPHCPATTVGSGVG